MKTNQAEFRRDFEERLSRLGYDLVQIEWAGNAHRPVIRLRVEREALDRPVSLDDCATVSRGVEGWLDEDARIPDRYVLEVSSPGLERPLTRDRDFRRFCGQRIAVNGKGALREGASRLEGRLLGLVEAGDGDASILLQLSSGDEVEVPRSRVAGARLVHEWKRPS
ncbi:MAG: ribosome maturation factor RimP [Gemmatimonadetes bacterium]|nr:ribosome maturation factor RimP [Gemmatimonadota bacterium]